MGKKFCGYDCCDSTESWPEYLEKKSAFEKKENLGVVRIGLPHTKEEFLNDIPRGNSKMFAESFQRSVYQKVSPEIREKFKKNNNNQPARYYFDPVLGMRFVVALKNLKYQKEYVSGKVISYKWLLKTCYFDSNLFKIKKWG